MTYCKADQLDCNGFCNRFDAPCIKKNCRFFGVMTYADLIRSMNDEELAEYIIDVIIEAYEHVNIPVNNRCEAIRDYLEALKRPVEDTE